MPFTTIENAIAAIAPGELVIVVDDEDRENEGDLIMRGREGHARDDGFMVRHTCGLICVPLRRARLDELQLPLMVAENTESMRPRSRSPSTLRAGTTTGISAADRATTVRALSRSRDPTRRPRPPRATSSRCETARAACSSGPATPRRRSTSPASPAAPGRRAGRGRRTTTARWRGCPSSSASPRARPRHDLDRRPHPLPAPPREAGAPGRRGPHPDQVRRLHCLRVRVAARRLRAHRVRPRRRRRLGERARPRALRVPDR